jgi:hypothetical protein
MPEDALEDLMIAEVAGRGNAEGVMPGQMPGLEDVQDDVPDLPPVGLDDVEDEPEDDDEVEAAVRYFLLRAHSYFC